MTKGLIDKPRVFYETIHPRNSRGWVVVRRTIPSSGRTSQAKIPANQMATIASSAEGLPDVSFSASNFLGQPLLVNFAETQCVCAHLSTPTENPAELAHCSYPFLLELGIPLPTTIIKNGETAVFVWHLNRPYRRDELPELALVQQTLSHLLSPLGALPETRELTSLIPLPGARIGSSDQFTAVMTHRGEALDKDHFEQAVLANVSASALKDLDYSGRVLVELQLLWHHRSLWIAQDSASYLDWLIYFGASLAKFCSSTQLKLELRAIAESLTGQSWQTIAREYKPSVETIALDAATGTLNFEGHSVSVNYPGWSQLIAGQLDITDAEVSNLGLQLLRPSANESRYTRHTSVEQSLIAFGADNFVPIQRLLLRNAA